MLLDDVLGEGGGYPKPPPSLRQHGDVWPGLLRAHNPPPSPLPPKPPFSGNMETFGLEFYERTTLSCVIGEEEELWKVVQAGQQQQQQQGQQGQGKDVLASA